MLVLGLAMISHGFRVRCIEHPPSNVAESNCYVYMILISFRSAPWLLVQFLLPAAYPLCQAGFTYTPLMWLRWSAV